MDRTACRRRPYKTLYAVIGEIADHHCSKRPSLSNEPSDTPYIENRCGQGDSTLNHNMLSFVSQVVMIVMIIL